MNYSMISNKSELHDVTISNLQDLSKHLKSVGVSLIADKLTVQSDVVGFDIGSYFSKIGGRDSGHICQSSACAIGHFAVMRGLACCSDGVIEENGRMIDWFGFAHKYIGISCDDATEVLWAWLFSDEWNGYDRSALGAAARIDHFLEHGVPSHFVEDGFFDEEYARTGNEGETPACVAPYLERRTAIEAEALEAHKSLNGKCHG